MAASTRIAAPIYTRVALLHTRAIRVKENARGALQALNAYDWAGLCSVRRQPPSEERTAVVHTKLLEEGAFIIPFVRPSDKGSHLHQYYLS